ncbi:hypothetical protein C5468_16450 [Photorhabdus luminescens subsp. mexicana]|uniref:Uncharacterized protein n=1 Tax=Photorhabdus luminescens subsp. mexicana TaxID=2100167 RepID=A0A4R4J462_PHOLU|nr:hypothetical protein C5468_16450 [Photorhabdus luminescens subsp. mexicana]
MRYSYPTFCYYATDVAFFYTIMLYSSWKLCPLNTDVTIFYFKNIKGNFTMTYIPYGFQDASRRQGSESLGA